MAVDQAAVYIHELEHRDSATSIAIATHDKCIANNEINRHEIESSSVVVLQQLQFMLDTIYITRHGFRSNWENTKWSPSPTGIDADPALASHGVEQAIELAAHMKKTASHIERIYTSPFYRCVQTIDHVAAALSMPIHVDNGIGEWYGVTRATHPSPATIEVLHGFFPRIDKDYKPSVIPSIKGETMVEIHDRVKKAIELIIADAEENGCRAILLCTHAATNIALGRALTGDPERTVPTGTCSLSKYVRDEGQKSWSGVLNGDCSFLREGEERNWWFDGDIPIYENEPKTTAGRGVLSTTGKL